MLLCWYCSWIYRMKSYCRKSQVELNRSASAIHSYRWRPFFVIIVVNFELLSFAPSILGVNFQTWRFVTVRVALLVVMGLARGSGSTQVENLYIIIHCKVCSAYRLLTVTVSCDYWYCPRKSRLALTVEKPGSPNHKSWQRSCALLYMSCWFDCISSKHLTL